MNTVSTISQIELGKRLAQVRDRAGIKQAELARTITWSPAVLSRVESGERQLAMDELQMVLAAIGTEEAARLQSELERDWLVLPRPALDHPDQDLLWDAEQVAKNLVALSKSPDIKHAFERRLSEYVSEISDTAGLIQKREHQIAIVGSIGIGKSTAICRLVGLEIPNQDGGAPSPVLEAGAGGITVCEVHLRTGPGYGIIIEPRSDDEMRADVADFADPLLGEHVSQVAQATSSEADAQGVSKEIERAIRNMSRLRIQRPKGADGKSLKGTDGKAIVRDEARELAKQVGSQRELIVSILARMELHKRDRRDIWYDATSGKQPLVWLKDTFEQINNGRHSEFALPKRIEVVVPDRILGLDDLSLRIIDTKGIDRTSARPDLEEHLDEPHTLAVLCSGFNDAPATATRLLLERACDAGVRSLDTRVALLVLPRPSEALAVKDESGIRVEIAEEGYELKAEQVALALQPIGLRDLSVYFFNAYEDAQVDFRNFLVERISHSRQAFRSRLNEILENARTLLANHEQEQVQEVIRDAAKMLNSWAGQNANPRPLSAHVQESLLTEISQAYASTIHATVRREGEWPNLSYSHHLGYGARRLAALSLERTVDGFSELCSTMVGNTQFFDAQDLIRQAERVMLASYEDLLRKIQLMGQASFRDLLKGESELWRDCENEWNTGRGYRDRVMSHNSRWFGGEASLKLDVELRAIIEREWSNALSRVTSLFDKDLD